MYHRVLPDGADVSSIEPGMYVRASTFAKQLRWLTETFRVGTLGQLLADPPAEGERPIVALTFDDGWLDNLTVAWPILQEARVRATIFLVRDWVVTGVNGEGEFMRPHDVTALAASGMEFGAHTTTHPRLDRMSRDPIEKEMRASRDAVEGWTGRRCELFAYPYGAANDEASAMARRLFRASVGVERAWWTPRCDRGRIPRIGVHQDMTSSRPMLMARLASCL
jgi:peptidoglycan/xylan/chitin deacetylase (PgdA/CDA1 family)